MTVSANAEDGTPNDKHNGSARAARTRKIDFMMGINRADKDSLKCTSNANYSQLMAGDRSPPACCGASLMKIINYLFKSRELGKR